MGATIDRLGTQREHHVILTGAEGSRSGSIEFWLAGLVEAHEPLSFTMA